MDAAASVCRRNFYLFFWQASEKWRRCEKEKLRRLSNATRHPRLGSFAASNGILGAACCIRTSRPISIILATAVTLHAAGVTSIETAGDAASALRPLAGDFAFVLFALGLLGVGLIGVSVLEGSAAYAGAEAMDWT